MKQPLVKLRIDSKGSARHSAELTVPAFMKRHLKSGMVFSPEWHSEGILYRYIRDDAVTLEEPEPAEWAKQAKWPSDLSEGQKTVDS